MKIPKRREERSEEIGREREKEREREKAETMDTRRRRRRRRSLPFSLFSFTRNTLSRFSFRKIDPRCRLLPDLERSKGPRKSCREKRRKGRKEDASTRGSERTCNNNQIPRGVARPRGK